ncbi:transposase [Actinosynnema sp. NPDC049800]
MPLWRAASANGADLLWRVHANIVLSVREDLPDRSYLSEIVATDHHYRRMDPVTVRVVGYALDDPARPGHDAPYRLITTILDHRGAPAKELAALYCQRWEIETALDELKTHQRGPGQVLRSRALQRDALVGYPARRRGPVRLGHHHGRRTADHSAPCGISPQGVRSYTVVSAPAFRSHPR